MQNFFDKALTLVDTVVTTLTSFQITNALDESVLGTYGNYHSIEVPVCTVLHEDYQHKKIRWVTKFAGQPEFTKMHLQGFYIQSTQGRQENPMVLWEHDRNGRVCLTTKPGEETGQNPNLGTIKFFEWQPVHVVNGRTAVLIKNLGSGKCLRNMGANESVQMVQTDMEDKSQWWYVESIGEAISRVNREAKARYSYMNDGDDD